MSQYIVGVQQVLRHDLKHRALYSHRSSLLFLSFKCVILDIFLQSTAEKLEELSCGLILDLGSLHYDVDFFEDISII